MRYDIDDEAPAWRRPLSLVAIAVLLTLASLAVLFATQPWGGTTTADDPTPAPFSGEVAAMSSRCGLPDGAQTIPEAAPVETWQMVGWAATPLSPHTFGPAEQADGIYTCFARNPAGAVMAAVLDAAQRGSPEVDAARYVEARYAEGENYEQGLQDLVEAEVPTDSPITGEVAGFRVFRYSRHAAAVEVALRYAEAPLAGQLIAAYYDMVWADGDWQLRMPQSFRSTARPLDTLRGYTAWTTPPRRTIRDPASPAGQAAGAPRPAPAWAVDQAQDGPIETMGAQRLTLVSATTRHPAVPVAAAAAPLRTAECSGFGLLKCGLDIATTPGVASSLIKQVPGAAVSAAASGAASTVMGEIADEVVAAQEWTLEVLLTAWLRSPDPDVTGADSATVWLEGHLAVLVVFATLGAVLLSTYRMATTGKLEHLGEIGMLLTRVILTGGLVGVVVTLGLQIGDMWSVWVLDQVEYDLSGLLTWSDDALPAMILVLLGLFMVVVQFFQFVVMMFRYGAVLYLCAVVTLLAATSSTRSGKQSWEKALAWLLAFVLYKPVAATIYAGTIFMTSPDQEVADRIVGIAMTVLALVALPALMRLIVPQTAALGAGNAGALAGATVGAAVATGAVLATGGVAAGAGLSGGATSTAAVGRGAGTVTGGGGGGDGGGAAGAEPEGGTSSGPGGVGPSAAGGPVDGGAAEAVTSNDSGDSSNAGHDGASGLADGGASSARQTGLSTALSDGQEPARPFAEGASADDGQGGLRRAGADVSGVASGADRGSSRSAGDLLGGAGRGVGAGGRFSEEAGAAVDGAGTTNEGQDS